MIPARLTLLFVVLALCAGLWVGDAWRAGRTAIEQNQALLDARDADYRTIADLKEAATKLQQHAVDGALAYQQAAELMGSVAEQLENDRAAIRQFEQRQANALAALAAARPDLRDLRLGDDVLRHWRASNAGPAADEPAAAPAAPAATGKPADAVPAAPAAAERRGAGADRQPRSGGGALSRLPGANGVAAEGGGRVAGHRLALVLPGGAGNGTDG